MCDFYANLKNNLNNPIYFKKNIEDFNKLNDQEIEQLFCDEEISGYIKKSLAKICYNKINTLPFDLFINVIGYLEDPNIFIEKYKKRIESLTKVELEILIYDSALSSECLVEIARMDNFKKNLKLEKEERKSTKYQSFDFITQIFLNKDNHKELIKIGLKILDLVKDQLNYSDDIAFLINFYFSKILKITLNEDICVIGIQLMNYFIKNHIPFSNEIIEFYILFHIRDLNLNDYLKKLIVSNENTNYFGSYQESTGTLKISNNYIKKSMDFMIHKQNNFEKETMNDSFNWLTLYMISHELSHILRLKEFKEWKESLAKENLKDNKSLYYWYKDSNLHLFLGHEKYHQMHDLFIEEVRADIFAILDSSIQIEKYFKASFPEPLLKKICASNAQQIINFYFSKNDKKFTTPIQKFDIFYNSYFPKEQKSFESELSNESVINNLLLGDQIPESILKELFIIANEEKIVTNIYEEILLLIKKMEFEKETKKVI